MMTPTVTQLILDQSIVDRKGEVSGFVESAKESLVAGATDQFGTRSTRS